MKSIALFLPNWIGDVVMATPTLRAIRAAWPTARIVAWGRSYIADVLAGCPWFDEFIALPQKTASLLRLAFEGRNQFDVGVLFPNSIRSALVATLVGCRRLIGYDRGDRGWLLGRRLYYPRGPRGRFRPTPIILSYGRLAEQIRAPVRSWKLELFTTPLDEQAADDAWNRFGISRGEKVVLLNPGGAFGTTKHWPIPYFARLAQKFVDQHRTPVIVLCGPSECEMAERIRSESNRASVHSLAEVRPSIGLSKACVRRSALLVTTDSGPRHFAAAFDIPCVTLFGPTHIEWTRTFHRREVSLQCVVPCGPCQRPVCQTDHRCMTELRPEYVYAAAQNLLERDVAYAA